MKTLEGVCHTTLALELSTLFKYFSHHTAHLKGLLWQQFCPDFVNNLCNKSHKLVQRGNTLSKL